MEKQNKFKIIIPSYNNVEWVECNLASILNQTYTKYEVIYIDDASTDETYKQVMSHVGDLPNWTIIRNSENKGAMYNYFHNLEDYVKDDSEIVIHLDGDDWFYDEMALESLNKFYNEKDCWMTYGGFIVWNGHEAEPTLPHPQSTLYSDFTHKHKLYRRDLWRASHLRTYRAFLLKAVNLEDLKDLKNNQYYWHASDLAFQYLCMEMCPSDKIQNIDFYAHVYNHSKTNQVRTHEREHADNSKYEVEIRNRKSYTQDLEGKKKPQINVFYDYMEYWTFPTDFTYCYNQTDGEFDMVYIGDDKIRNYLQGDYKIQRDVPVVARLMEHRSYFKDELHQLVKKNHSKFHTILTHDKELLNTLPNAKFTPTTDVIRFNMLPNPSNAPTFGPYSNSNSLEMPSDLFQVYPKNKLVSHIGSNKTFLPGHRSRLEMLKSTKGKVDLFGTVQLAFYDEMIRHENKFEGLKDYAFSIAIENLDSSIDDYYFSEKITDCFITGTIPIYYGCPNISNFFNLDGILVFNTADELSEIVDNLSMELYHSKLEAVRDNYERAIKTPLTNDKLYNQYFKQIINNK